MIDSLKSMNLHVWRSSVTSAATESARRSDLAWGPAPRGYLNFLTLVEVA